ncbi:hypothetical protein [Vibrio phage BONAISHI]|nr:hypothetical protein [Vibrio phage BONAISHI]
MFKWIKKYISFSGWKNDGAIVGMVHLRESSNLSARLGQYSTDSIDPWRSVGLLWDVNHDDVGHRLEISLWKFFLEIEINVRWINALTYKLTRSSRRLGLEISKSRFELSLFNIDNDYADEYSWLKRKGMNTDNRGKWWFKLFWRVRRGYNYSFWWDRLQGDTVYQPKKIVGHEIEACYELEHAGKTHSYRLPFTVDLEIGQYTRTSIFGFVKEDKQCHKMSIQINRNELDSRRFFHIPTRYGKGENSWDCDDCPILYAGTGLLFGDLPKPLTRHGTLAKCDLVKETPEFRQAVRYMVEQYAEHVLHEWKKYGRANDTDSSKMNF